MTAVQAAAAWQQEWAEMTAHAELPVIVFPWHDYGITGFDDPDYNVQMFTSLIETAYQAGSEFVTLADLAQRINAFEKSGLTFNMVDADTVSATVGSTGFLGTFALDLDGGQKIKSVAGWYAYDEDSVFLPSAGGTFTIDLGATPDDVTHITALPSRAELLSATSPGGGGLDFSVKGEGKLVIDLANPNGRPVLGHRCHRHQPRRRPPGAQPHRARPARRLRRSRLLSLSSEPGDDLLIGTDGADWIDALAGNDTVNGGAGDDTLIGGAGDDWLDGGAGYDIAAMGTIGFRGVGVGLSGGSAVMTSSAGTDRLANTEIVTFADGRLVMDANDPAARVARLYEAALDRLPDQGGLNFWIDAVQGGQPIRPRPAASSSPPEFQARASAARPSSNDAFVDQLYLNVLGRAGEPGGRDLLGGRRWTAASRAAPRCSSASPRAPRTRRARRRWCRPASGTAARRRPRWRGSTTRCSAACPTHRASSRGRM